MMNFHKLKILNIVLAITFLFTVANNVYAVKPKSTKFYAVIFGIIIDKNGKLLSFKVSKVINPSSGSDKPVKIKVPNSYFQAARKRVINKGYKPQLENGKPKEFYTYFFYDPMQPDRTDIDPRK